MARKLIAFPYYGGKYSKLKWLLPLLPDAKHYCEPFCGSAAVVLNRSKSDIETINDLNGDIVNFFSVLRDTPDELVSKLKLTPYARGEFANAINSTNLDSVDRARCFFTMVRQSINNKPNPNISDWSFRRITNNTSKWVNAIDNLHAVADRLKTIQIECDDAIKVIQRYDTPETLFYVDPPYVHSTRTSSKDYAIELEDSYHVELATVLNNVKGKVALSGYNSGLYNDLYANWYKVERDVKAGVGSKRTEVLYRNFAD